MGRVSRARVVPTTRYLTPQEVERICALRREGCSLVDIVARTGRCERTVGDTLRRAGAPRLRATQSVRSRNRELAAQVARLARRGGSQDEVAAALGVTRARVSNVVRRLDLAAGLLPVALLARELGVTDHALLRACAHTPWFTGHMFTPEQADAARTHYAGHRTAQAAAHWLTSAQAARELGMHQDTFLAAFRKGELPGVTRARLIGPGGSGQAMRYEPQGVLALARARRNPLPGAYTRPGVLLSGDVAALACRSGDTVRQWAQRLGAPCLRDRRGRIWFDLAALLPWLDAQAQPSYPRAAASIRRGTAQGRAA